MTTIERMLAESREGYLRLDVHVGTVAVPVLFARSDLYILGFEARDGWWRFSDAGWPFTPQAKSLGHDGRYAMLGGLSGAISYGSIEALARLRDPGSRGQWKPVLRTLLIVVAECARLIPVRMRVLGMLNGIIHQINVSDLSGYIQSWSAASKGRDMAREVAPRIRIGHSDPTIIRR